MAYGLLMTATALALLGAGIHGIIGARVYLGHIRASNLAALTQSLSVVAWHMFTIFLLGCAAAFAYIAETPDAARMAYPLIGINLAGAGMFVALALAGHAHLLRMPGAYLMAATGALAWAGVS